MSLVQDRKIFTFDLLKENKNDYFKRDKYLFEKDNKQILEFTAKKRDRDAFWLFNVNEE